MRLPWVSIALLDRADAELERALAQIDRQQARIVILEEHNIRMDRKEHGLPEKPRPVKPRDTEPIPPEIREYLEAFDSMEVRANIEDDIAMARSQGTPWTEILRLVAISEDQDVLT